MNKLQKSAWFNLGMITVCIIISMPFLFYLTKRNAKGIDYIIIFLIVGSITGLAAYLLIRKKGFEAGLDEREKQIYKRAFIWSAMALAAFLGCICFIPFFALGGQNVIKVYYLPMIFLSTLFAAQLVHSTAIIIQCSLEG